MTSVCTLWKSVQDLHPLLSLVGHTMAPVMLTYMRYGDTHLENTFYLASFNSRYNRIRKVIHTHMYFCIIDLNSRLQHFEECLTSQMTGRHPSVPSADSPPPHRQKTGWHTLKKRTKKKKYIKVHYVLSLSESCGVFCFFCCYFCVTIPE